MCGSRIALAEPRSRTIKTDVCFSAVRAQIRSHIAQNIPSMAVAVVQDGHILWEEAFGLADRESRRRATPYTMYPVASLSKSLTATGIMKLVQDGRLSLDASVNGYLPFVRAYGGESKDLTVRMLLDMKGGIPHLVQFYWDDEKSARQNRPGLLERYSFCAFPPGHSYHYSNLSYGLLALIAAKASKKPFSQFMESEVFRRTGMRHTALADEAVLDSHSARRYAFGESGSQPCRVMEPEGGAGFWTCAHDLALYALMHLGHARKPLLSQATLATIHKLDNGKHYQYGWGRMDEGSGYMMELSDGSMLGGSGVLKIIPSKCLAVIVLTNVAAKGDVTYHVADNLIDAVVPGYLKRLTAERKSVVVPEAFREEPYHPTPDWLGEWSGVIKTQGADVAISLAFTKDGKVTARVGEQDQVPVKDLQFEGKMLTGVITATLTTPDTSLHPHRLTLQVRRIGNSISGYVMAWSTSKRPIFGLPFCIRMNLNETSARP